MTKFIQTMIQTIGMGGGLLLVFLVLTLASVYAIVKFPAQLSQFAFIVPIMFLFIAIGALLLLLEPQLGAGRLIGQEAGDDQQGDLAEDGRLPQMRQDVVAAQVRHVEIEDQEVRSQRAHEVHRAPPRPAFDRAIAGPREGPGPQRADRVVIVGDHDQRGRRQPIIGGRRHQRPGQIGAVSGFERSGARRRRRALAHRAARRIATSNATPTRRMATSNHTPIIARKHDEHFGKRPGTHRWCLTVCPLVMVGVGDPVGLGLIASLARPGGNVTGLSYSVGTETSRKGLELFKETVPKVRRVAILSNPANPAHALTIGNLKGAARSLGVQLQLLETRDPNAFDAAFAAMAKERAGALLVVADPFFMFNRARLADLAARHQLPSRRSG